MLCIACEKTDHANCLNRTPIGATAVWRCSCPCTISPSPGEGQTAKAGGAQSTTPGPSPAKSIGQAVYEAVMVYVIKGFESTDVEGNWAGMPPEQQEKWEQAGQKIQEYYEAGLGAKISR